MKIKEIWKDTKYPGYQVSNLGNVRSEGKWLYHARADGTIYFKQFFPGTVLKPSLTGAKNRKYYKVNVWDTEKSKGVNRYIHRLVAEAFIPNPNNYPVVNHKDGNKLNNVYTNLEWCSYSHNNQHAIDTGLRKPKNSKNL